MRHQQFRQGIAMNETTAPLTPAARARNGAEGRPVTMQGGAEWLIANDPTGHGMDGIRDRIHDHATRDGCAQTEAIHAGALCLLRQNYDLTFPEALQLIQGADGDALAQAVAAGLLGPRYGDPKRRTTYSMWVRSTLAANGLKASEIEPALIHDVIDCLVKTGRAVPEDHYCDLADWVRRKKLRHAAINEY
jgi:hypothetical protein